MITDKRKEDDKAWSRNIMEEDEDRKKNGEYKYRIECPCGRVDETIVDKESWEESDWHDQHAAVEGRTLVYRPGKCRHQEEESSQEEENGDEQ